VSKDVILTKIGCVGERRGTCDKKCFFKVPEYLFCLTMKNEFELLLNVKSCIT